jgi:type IV secretory pathway VirB2 component (pilin)
MIPAQIMGVTAAALAVVAVIPFLGMFAVSGTDPDWDWLARFRRLFLVLIVLAGTAGGAAIVLMLRG